MWNEKTLKIIPALLFLFCILEIFEMALIVDDMNKTEKLEAEIRNNLKALEHIMTNEHLEGMDLEHPKDKRIKLK
ncbi:hypothetical protein [Helicobacter pylori]|uniref:hypothetical protein n=1 Tax=Helicobacter pylori TaxID=210 RepID=UPI001C59203D|nr:hypothetical protein [Helicobacter pylori]